MLRQELRTAKEQLQKTVFDGRLKEQQRKEVMSKMRQRYIAMLNKMKDDIVESKQRSAERLEKEWINRKEKLESEWMEKYFLLYSGFSINFY